MIGEYPLGNRQPGQTIPILLLILLLPVAKCLFRWQFRSGTKSCCHICRAIPGYSRLSERLTGAASDMLIHRLTLFRIHDIDPIDSDR